VSEPEIRTSQEAMGYVSELQLLVRRINISDADMDKGQMRFDCNLSLQTQEEHQAGKLPKYKVEVKNINSVRAMGRAIEYEIIRQTALLESGETPAQETRGWRDDLNKSESQRSKEDAMDYRYFPEPDLQILVIKPEDIQNLNDLPELPNIQRKRYLDLDLNMQISNTFVNQNDVGQLFDRITTQESTSTLLKTLANIITGSLIALSEKLEKPIFELLSDQNLIELAQLFEDKKINNQGLSKALEILTQNPEKNTSEVVDEESLLQVNDDTALQAFVEVVVENNPSVVEEYKSGKVQVLGFLVGQCMKESKGKGNPQKFSDILKTRLS